MCRWRSGYGVRGSWVRLLPPSRHRAGDAHGDGHADWRQRSGMDRRSAGLRKSGLRATSHPSPGPMEVAYLFLNGELPTKEQLAYWNCEIMHHTLTHENVKKFMDGFHHDAHPMGILMSTVRSEERRVGKECSYR